MSIYNKNGVLLNDAYNRSAGSLNYAYDKLGNVVFNRNEYAEYVTTPLMTLPSSDFASTSMQGMAISSGVLFQFVADNSVSLINMSDGSLVSKLTANSDHGDAASFSSEKYDVSDEFPLLYVTSDTSPAKVYVLRATRSSISLIRTLTFPLADTGYYAAHALDSQNKVIYMVGYKNNDYQTPNNSNEMIISSWDISTIATTDIGTFTPTKISSFNVPFIYVAQDQVFHNNLIFVASGYPNTVQKLYIINPTTQSIYYATTLEGTSETEGVDFAGDIMIIGQRPFTYTRYEFV